MFNRSIIRSQVDDSTVFYLKITKDGSIQNAVEKDEATELSTQDAETLCELLTKYGCKNISHVLATMPCYVCLTTYKDLGVKENLFYYAGLQSISRNLQWVKNPEEAVAYDRATANNLAKALRLVLNEDVNYVKKDELKRLTGFQFLR